MTQPEGAEVWKGSVLLGITGKDGLLLRDLHAGSLTLSIRKPGFREVERRVETAGTSEARTVLVRLEPAGSSAGGDGSTRPGKGRSKAILIGALGAAGAGIAVATLNNSKDPRSNDDGDGFSEKDGDCNDLDRAVNPRGEFSISVTPAVGGMVDCRARFGSVEFRATNLGCSNVTASSATVTTTVLGGDCLAFSPSTSVIPLVVSSVAPGAREQVIARRTFDTPVSCCGIFCASAGTCFLSQTHTVQTSVGTRTVTTPYSIFSPQGTYCPSCPAPFVAGEGLFCPVVAP